MSGEGASAIHLRRDLHRLYGDRFQPASNLRSVGTVWPLNTWEVSAATSLASKVGVPLAVTRPAGPNSIRPAADALAVCLDRMDKVLHVDTDRQLAKVQCGATWTAVADIVASHCLMPRVLPVCPDHATIGSFLGEGGRGSGSFEFGRLQDNVQRARVVAADGRISLIAGGRLDVSRSNGAWDIATELTIALQPLVAMRPLVGAFDDATALQACLADIARTRVPVWSVNLLDPAAGALRNPLDERSRLTVPPGRYAALFVVRKNDDWVAAHVCGAVANAAGRILQHSGSLQEWTSRFTAPSRALTPLMTSVRLELGQLTQLLCWMRPSTRARLAFQGLLSDCARSLTLDWFPVAAGQSVADNAVLATDLLALAHNLGAEVGHQARTLPQLPAWPDS